MKIKITSPCMAMLIYEAAKSKGQVEGCLYGEVAQEVTKNITDSDVTTTVDEVLSVHSIGPLQLPDCNENEQLSTNVNSNVFGWFRFCRRPLLRLTVREKSIHRKLARSLVSRDGVPGHVVTVLMHERWSENQSTYLWKVAAFLQRDRWFIPCRIEIVNLKATLCGSYKSYPSIHQQHMLPQVTKTLSALNSSFSANSANSSFDMVQTVRNSGQEIVKTLNESIVKLRNTESLLESAYEEQISLKKTLFELKALLSKKSNEAENSILTKQSLAISDSDSNATASSDSAEYYDDDKANELLSELDDQSDNIVNLSPSSGQHHPSSSDSKVSEDHEKSIADGAPPPPYDPFDSLVHKAKADLIKEEASTSVHKKYNDGVTAEPRNDQPWSSRTRSGRARINPDEN